MAQDDTQRREFRIYQKSNAIVAPRDKFIAAHRTRKGAERRAQQLRDLGMQRIEVVDVQAAREALTRRASP